jgi:tetratricopeptide (TPR) repeat protein
MGGIGKTQLAIEYAHRNRDSYHGIYWISGVEEASLLSGFQDVAKITGCIDTSLNPADVATGVLSWLREQDNWLLFIDNLDNVSVVDGYLPEMVSGGHTIITTRNPDAISIPAEGLELEVLHPDTATELLLTRSKVDDVANSEAAKTEAARIVDMLGYLPLAIEQAAAYIREASKDIFAFLASYHENRRVLHRRVPHGNWGYTSSVATTWLLSFDEVAKRNASAAQLLQLFAFLSPDDILIDFLRIGKEALNHDLQALVQMDIDLNDALFMLERFSLIKRLRSGKAISIHRLVQAVIQDEMSPGLLTKNWEIFIGMCNETFPWELTNETILECRHYQDQVLIPLTAAPIIKSFPLRQGLRCVAKFLAADGKYKKAEELAQTAVDISTKISGKEHPDTLADLNLLACTHWYQARFHDAVTIHEEVLEIRKRILGDNHPDTLKTMNNLSLTYRYQGRFDSAAQLQQQALTASIQLLGEEHPDTLVGMNALGATYRSLRQFEDARRLQERAVELRKKIVGEQHIDTLRSMRSLAATLQDEGSWEKSVRLDEFVLAERRRILGDEHPETLGSIHELGITYWYQGRHSGVHLVEKALAGRKRILGDNHLDTLTSLKDLESIRAGRSKRSGACSFKTS